MTKQLPQGYTVWIKVKFCGHNIFELMFAELTPYMHTFKIKTQ
jgi:hypothetical protein